MSKKSFKTKVNNMTENQAPTIADNGVEDNTATEETSAEDIGQEPEVAVQESTPVEEVTQSAPVVVETSKEVVVKSVTETSSASLGEFVTDAKNNGTQQLKGFLSSLETYCSKMAPGVPMPGDTGARNQYNLWQSLNSISKLPYTEFKKSWNLFLSFVNSDKAFDNKYLFRFSEFWLWSHDELDAFQRLLNIAKLTCDPAKRSHGLKEVSLDRSLEKFFTEESRQNIINFYH